MVVQGGVTYSLVNADIYHIHPTCHDDVAGDTCLDLESGEAFAAFKFQIHHMRHRKAERNALGAPNVLLRRNPNE